MPDKIKLLLETARAAVDAKRIVIEKKQKEDTARRIHLKQVEEAEKVIVEAVAPEIDAQVEAIMSELSLLDIPTPKSVPTETKTHQETAGTLLSLTFDSGEWRDRMVNKMLPILAVKMAEAGVAQMMVMGVDPRVKNG